MRQVSVRDCRDEDRRWIASVYREYLNDLATSATGLFPALPGFGHGEPDQLSGWFADASIRVLTVLYGEEPVGFAKIKVLSARAPSGVAGHAGPAGPVGPVGPNSPSGPTSRTGLTARAQPAGPTPRPGAYGTRADEGPEFSMTEFFIEGAWRRRGIGAQAVRLILDRFTGRWLISELLRNDPAVRFWRRVVGSYTGGAYQEAIVDGEVRQRFESGTRRRAG